MDPKIGDVLWYTFGCYTGTANRKPSFFYLEKLGDQTRDSILIMLGEQGDERIDNLPHELLEVAGHIDPVETYSEPRNGRLVPSPTREEIIQIGQNYDAQRSMPSGWS